MTVGLKRPREVAHSGSLCGDDSGSPPPLSDLHARQVSSARISVESLTAPHVAQAEAFIPPHWEIHRISTRASGDAGPLRVGFLCIDRERGVVSFEDGCPIRLTNCQQAILLALAVDPAACVSIDSLTVRLKLQKRWQVSYGVKGLRRRFGRDIVRFDSRRAGYRLGSADAGQVGNAPLSLRSWTLCPTHRLLQREGWNPIALSVQESALLELLARQPGDILTYACLGEALSPDMRMPPGQVLAIRDQLQLRLCVPGFLVEEIPWFGLRLQL